jgi:valyl-tRNA synthetase
MNLEDYTGEYDKSKLCKEDKWILSKVNKLAEEMSRNIDNFDLGVATQKIYDFIWNEFCDWYIEIVKPRLYDKDCLTRKEAQFTLNTVLEYSLKMLHPIMPFVTEEIYTKLYNNDETIMTSAWPKFREDFNFEAEENEIEMLKSIIGEVRNIRNNMNVHPAKKAKLIFVTEKYNELINQSALFLQKLAFGDEIIVQANKDNIPSNAISIMQPELELYIPFEDLVDIAAEKERLENEKTKLEAEVERAKKMLSNPGFVSKAPEAKINEEKEKLAKYEEMLKNTIERLKNL